MVTYRPTEGHVLKRLLDGMEGLPIRHGLPTDVTHPYCDMCNEPIYPNKPAHLLWTEKPVVPDSIDVEGIVGGQLTAGGLILMHVSHEGCTPVLPLPCLGYLEMVVEATWDRDYTLSRPSVLAITSRNEGKPWDPVAAHNVQAEIIPNFPDLETYLRREEIALSPQDFIFQLMVTGIDPRLVVDWETGEIIATENADAIRAAFEEGVDNLMEEWKDNPPAGIRFGYGDPSVDHRDEWDGDNADISADEVDEEQ